MNYIYMYMISAVIRCLILFISNNVTMMNPPTKIEIYPTDVCIYYTTFNKVWKNQTNKNKETSTISPKSTKFRLILSTQGLCAGRDLFLPATLILTRARQINNYG